MPSTDGVPVAPRSSLTQKIKRRTEVIPASNADWSTEHSFEYDSVRRPMGTQCCCSYMGLSNSSRSRNDPIGRGSLRKIVVRACAPCNRSLSRRAFP